MIYTTYFDIYHDHNNILIYEVNKVTAILIIYDHFLQAFIIIFISKMKY